MVPVLPVGAKILTLFPAWVSLQTRKGNTTVLNCEYLKKNDLICRGIVNSFCGGHQWNLFQSWVIPYSV